MSKDVWIFVYKPWKSVLKLLAYPASYYILGNNLSQKICVNTRFNKNHAAFARNLLALKKLIGALNKHSQVRFYILHEKDPCFFIVCCFSKQYQETSAHWPHFQTTEGVKHINVMMRNVSVTITRSSCRPERFFINGNINKDTHRDWYCKIWKNLSWRGRQNVFLKSKYPLTGCIMPYVIVWILAHEL